MSQLSHFDIDYYTIQRKFSSLNDDHHYVKNLNDFDIQSSISIVCEKILSDFKSYFSQLEYTKISIDIQQLDSYIKSLNNLLNRENNNSKNLLDYFKTLYEKLNEISFLPKLTSEINHAIQILNYLINHDNDNSSNNKSINFNERVGIEKPIKGILDEINSLKEEKINKHYFSKDGTVLVLHGYRCWLSQLQVILTRASQDELSNLKDIVIIALERVALDCDFTRHSTNLSIFSPKWVIDRPCTINLSGRDGAKQKVDNNFDKNGNGLIGAPGQQGGSFYGVCNSESIQGSNFLSVISNGGEGGNGSDGRKGEAVASSTLNIKPSDLVLKSNKDPDLSTSSYSTLKGNRIEFENGKSLIISMKNYLKAQGERNILLPKEFNGFTYIDFIRKYWLEDLGEDADYQILVDRYLLKDDFSNMSKNFSVTSIFSPKLKFNSVEFRANGFNSLDIWAKVVKNIKGCKGGLGGLGGPGGRAGRICIYSPLDRQVLTFKATLKNGANGSNGLNGQYGDTLSLSKDVFINAKLNFDYFNIPQISLQDRGNQIQVIVPDNTRSIDLPTNKDVVESEKVKSNFIGSRIEYINYILNLNNGLKHIDIISAPYIKGTINNVSKISLNEILLRLIEISTCYSDSHNPDTFMSFYYQLKEDLTLFLNKAKKENTLFSLELVNTIKYIYQLICSSIFRFKTLKDVFIVTNIKPFLNVISNNINTLESLKKIDVIKMYKENYSSSIHAKINEARSFIQQLEDDIQLSQDQLIQDLNTLIQESNEEIKKGQEEITELQQKSFQLKRNFALRLGFNFVKIGCKAATLGFADNFVEIFGDLVIPEDPDLDLSASTNKITEIDLSAANQFLDQLHDNHHSISDQLDALEYQLHCQQYERELLINPNAVFVPFTPSTKPTDQRIGDLQAFKDLSEKDQIVLATVELDYLESKNEPQEEIETKKKQVKRTQAKNPIL
ncbi:hypothetical protein CYY_002823 [Polysphondylium violaceum]|uniref:Uncharacterized protein n=1 Tax=Polysphondylium violaceum TaxID=133409 RepID=A0A8J4V6J2_9MYCE|nr:hypothetical protein CYY_002823 [Polysphondylium violaceum]